MLSFVLYKVLLTDTKNKEIRDTDIFTLNLNYFNRMYKIKLPIVSYKPFGVSQEEAGKKLDVKIEDDRRLLIEATIVRVMKSRRKLEHNLLMTEVVRILSNRFKPDPTHIKNRIESLIEKEYLERAESDRRLYLYKA